MKKGIVGILAIVVLLIIVSLFPIYRNSTIGISATFENTILQTMHSGNWKNWYPEIKEAYEKDPSSYSIKETNGSKKSFTIFIPGKKIIIHAMGPMSYNVTEITANEENNFVFTVFPEKSYGKMNIFLERKSSLIGTLFGNKKAGENCLIGLKSYLENPKELYGFDIKMSEIRDPIIASTVFKTPANALFRRIQNALNLLNQYIDDHKLLKSGHVSISYSSLKGDSLQLTVGIPVNKLSDPYKGVKCLSLPGKGKVLVGNYNGKFSRREKIYLAMSKYLTDHTLSAPAESFERYLNDSIPVSDSSDIRMELNYPVY